MYYLLKKIKFTLIELIVALAVLVLLVTVILQMFNTVNKSTDQSRAKIEMFENARIALELISRDIHTIYYETDAVPFWHWAPVTPSSPPASWGENRNEFLAFISATSIPPNDNITSTLCEVKYQKYYSDTHDVDSDGWLMRSVTGNVETDNTTDSDWNYHNNFFVGYKTNYNSATGYPDSAFTANDDSSNSYQKVIPYVTNLTFTCFDKDYTKILPDDSTSILDDLGQHTEFPFSIKISISVLDKNSWTKWVNLGGNVNPLNDTIAAKTFREKNERTFTKIIYIGNRGQYD